MGRAKGALEAWGQPCHKEMEVLAIGRQSTRGDRAHENGKGSEGRRWGPDSVSYRPHSASEQKSRLGLIGVSLGDIHSNKVWQ